MYVRECMSAHASTQCLLMSHLESQNPSAVKLLQLKPLTKDSVLPQNEGFLVISVHIFRLLKETDTAQLW